MMRRAGLSTPPIPPSPSTPHPTTHQFLWWQAPVPDRHQRAGNIGILCHRFCSWAWKRNNTMQILNTFVYNNWRTSPGTGVAAFLFIFALLSSLQQSSRAIYNNILIPILTFEWLSEALTVSRSLRRPSNFSDCVRSSYLFLMLDCRPAVSWLMVDWSFLLLCNDFMRIALYEK